MKIPDLDDSQYRQRLSAGDPQVLEEVFDHYTLYVANRACKKGYSHEDAEDITQEAVFAVSNAIRSALKVGSQLTFDSRADFEGYLMTTAFSKIHNYANQ